jgi:hypothetical protein
VSQKNAAVKIDEISTVESNTSMRVKAWSLVFFMRSVKKILNKISREEEYLFEIRRFPKVLWPCVGKEK